MASMIGAGSAALRKMIANPLNRRERDEQDQPSGFDQSLSGDSINAIIESEIIPRLLMAHADRAHPAKASRGTEISPLDASNFVSMSLSQEAAELLEEIEAHLNRGVAVEVIYIELLAPAARKLGEMWEDDSCDFVEVTMGLWRLQEVVRELAERSPPVTRALSKPHSALFAPLPGDQHSFGAVMIEDVFARAGWHSEVLIDPRRRDLLEAVAHRSYDLVGLTVTRDCPSAALQHVINATRSVSANPNLAIMIGGKVIQENPTFVEEVGADGTADDALGALALAEQLVLSKVSPTATVK